MTSHTKIPVKVLARGAPDGARDAFEGGHVMVELQKDTPATIVEKLGIARAFVCYYGRIIEPASTVKQWYDGRGPVVVVTVRADYIESDEVQVGNPAARLVDAGIPISHALKALGRAFWHEGFTEFSDAATDARRLVERTGKVDYARRTQVACMDELGNITPVGPFREYGHPDKADLVLPPGTVGHLQPLQVRGVWRGSNLFHKLSSEERADLKKSGRVWDTRRGFLEHAARAVVRVFGFHAVDETKTPLTPRVPGHFGGDDVYQELLVDESDERYDPVPFTAFFVTPTLLLCTRSCLYCPKRESYASRFMWTRNTRATLGMLRSGVDLFRCEEVKGVSSFLVDKIRSIGIELTENLVPPGNMAVPWNDYMLLEVDKAQASEVYLLPELDKATKGVEVATIAYHERPSEEWISEVFGDRGHKTEMTERGLSDAFWGFNIKMASLGYAKEDEEQGVLQHTCSLLPSSTGSPIFTRMEPREGEDGVPLLTFSAINGGRSVADVLERVVAIEASSTSASAEKVAKSLNMFNEGLTVHHISFILLYQEFLAPRLQDTPARGYLQSLLAPFRIFVQPEVLSRCHRKMLKDAEDHNEWGMSFWERHDTDSALFCFREGARMFCIATIPDMSELETRLKDALQSNVSAVVMARTNRPR